MQFGIATHWAIWPFESTNGRKPLLQATQINPYSYTDVLLGIVAPCKPV